MSLKFLATFDLHYGYERRNGHKIALHDPKAWASVMKFAQDFKPNIWIFGGDVLDCGPISHHNRNKPGRVEGLRILADSEGCLKEVINPVKALMGDKQIVYIIGNHEKWLNDFVEEMPALEGIVDVEKLLNLSDCTVVQQGNQFHLGKLTFVHGDTVSGGEHCAKSAVISYERNIRFGHMHTHQTYTKTSPLNYKNAKTGVAVPCLCTKTPKYGEGKPNRWAQGFNYGYVQSNGFFNDYVATIIDGRFHANDKEYRA